MCFVRLRRCFIALSQWERNIYLVTRTCRIHCACASRPGTVRSVRSCVNRAPGRPGLHEFRSAMGKVNVAKLRYMSRDDFRVLTAVRSTPFFPLLCPFPPSRPFLLLQVCWEMSKALVPPERSRRWDWGKRRSDSQVFQKPLSTSFYFPPLEAKAPARPSFLLPFSRITFQSLWPGKFLWPWAAFSDQEGFKTFFFFFFWFKTLEEN